MASYFELAGAAIVKAVIDVQPEAASSWRDIKPQTNWGMGLNAWATFLASIINNFNAMVAPKRLDPAAMLDGFRDKRLSDLQWAISGKVIP